MMLTLYGIPNCDTVKKARAWLAERGAAYRFHDLRKDGLDVDRLQGWIDALGWEALLNRSGTTWRKLPEDQKDGVDAVRAKALMQDQVAIIRRPIVEWGNQVSVGFKPDEWQARLGG